MFASIGHDASVYFPIDPIQKRRERSPDDEMADRDSRYRQRRRLL